MRLNWVDSEGGNHGTVIGDEEYSPGQKAFAFDFDGFSFIKLSNENNFDFERTEPFSISVWVKPNTGIINNRQIIAKTNNLIGAADSGYSLFYNQGGLQGTNDRVMFFMADSSLNIFSIMSSFGSITMDDWNHVVITYSGNSNQNGLNVYINGVLNTSGTANPISLSILNDRTVTIGAESDGGRKFGGQIDDVRFYNIELTASQIAALSAT